MPKAQKEKPPHPSMARLMAAAQELVPSIAGHSDLALWLKEGPQVVTNWARRGVSQDGALKAQAAHGISATWILLGTGDSRTAPAPATTHRVAEPAAPGYASITPPGGIDWAVQIIAEAMANLTPIGRGMAESTLASIAKDPAQAGTVIELLAVLIRSHGTPAAPPPKDKTPTKAKTKAHARATGTPKLVVLKGDGGDRQATYTQIPLLPLKTVDNPFRAELAPERERRHYEKWTAPKMRDASERAVTARAGLK